VTKSSLDPLRQTAPAREERTTPDRLSFWTQLRFKVIAPYLALALLLTIAGTFFLTRVFAERLHERLLSQLWEAGRYATDEVVYIERELLASLRAIAWTQGVDTAVIGGDVATLRDLVYPIATNAGLDLVEITTLDGRGLVSLHRDLSTPTSIQYEEQAGLSFTGWPLLERVVAGDIDDIGDKFAGLVDTPWGWCFYISGPIKHERQTIGVVLVGLRMPQMVERMAGRESSQHTAVGSDLPEQREITLFDDTGQVIVTTFEDVSAPTLAISPDWYHDVLGGQDFRYLGRELTIDEEDIEEAFGAFEARHGEDMGVFSVALPGRQQEQWLIQVAMAFLFSAAVAAVVLVGIWVSAQIVRPILELVRAARRVEGGDLSRKVVVRTEDELGLLAQAFNRMIQGLRVKEFIRDAFGRFVSRDVSEALLRGEIRLQGEKRVATMLFADIRDFTRLSEQYEPDTMVRILNDYFTGMVEVAQTYGGTVNKFGGDSTLVIFGAPVTDANHADHAIRAALGMRRRLAQLNAERLTRGEVPIRMGIGINTGDVVAGTVGSLDRMEYTVIGDSVNLSARVQGLNKEFPEYDILVSEYTHDALREPESYVIRNLGPMAVKGKTDTVRIYAVVGLAEQEDERERTAQT
jgi:adenylate cyclase